MCKDNCKNTFSVKKVGPSKVLESYLKVNAWTDWWQDLISEYCQGLVYEHINITLEALQLANYCFWSLIGLANLLSVISCYKFHILKDSQENIKVTNICHLAAFYLYVVTDRKGSQMTNNCDFYILLLIF